MKGTQAADAKRNRRDPYVRNDMPKPKILGSSYKQEFPDWKNGNDVFIEKAPQFPVY